LWLSFIERKNATSHIKAEERMIKRLFQKSSLW
jgi:hypothetical protein